MFDSLRKIDGEVPVLLVTGFSEDAMANALRNRVRGCLPKPFPLGDLINKVREIVSFA